MKLIVILFYITMLASCVSHPTQEEINSADYGPVITKEHAKETVTAFLKSYLKDPESAVIEWGPFSKSYMVDGLIYGGGTKFGYRLDAKIKAKNSYGAYTGYQPYYFLIRGDEVVTGYKQQVRQGAYGSTNEMAKIK